MEALMAHLTLQLGAAVIIPFGPPSRINSSGCGWRGRALRAAAPGSLAAVLLAGCATVHPVATTVVTTGMPNPEESLLQSMQHVDVEMAELGQLSPSIARADTPLIPEDLQRIVSFQWTGSLDQAIPSLPKASATSSTRRPRRTRSRST